MSDNGVMTNEKELVMYSNSKQEMYRMVQERFEMRSMWSDYSVEEMGAKHNYFGKTLVYKDHWGKQPVTVRVEGDTMVDLWKAADAAIRLSGDQHHIFIEKIELIGDTLVLTTGS
jgi:hypothetical protein